MMFLLGKHAMFGHDPPMYLRSTTATRLPSPANVHAAMVERPRARAQAGRRAALDRARGHEDRDVAGDDPATLERLGHDHVVDLALGIAQLGQDLDAVAAQKRRGGVVLPQP